MSRLLLVLLFAGCVAPLPLADRPCPCTDGYVCCAELGVCLPERALCPDEEGSVDSGRDASLPEEEQTVLVVRPAGATIAARGVVAFTTSEPVTWSIAEGASGGTVDDRGLYRAPAEPGTYDIVARSQLDPARVVVVPVRVELTTPRLELLVGSLGGAGSTDGEGAQARFGSPASLLRIGEHLYVADTINQTIRRLNVTTGVVDTVAGVPPTNLATSEEWSLYNLTHPSALAEGDAPDTLFVLASGLVRRVDLTTGRAPTIAGGNGRQHSTDGVGSEAALSTVTAIASDGAGGLYLADPHASTIRKLDIATGAVTTVVGKSFESGREDGPAAGARLHNPTGLAWDGQRLWIADAGNHAVRRFDPATGLVVTFAGGVPGISSDGLGTAARFGNLRAIACEGDGRLAVTDGNAVRRIDVATGQVFTVAGAALEAGTADGLGSGARFFYPSGVAGGADGSLYVADQGNYTVRRVSPGSPVVTTVAGLAQVATGSADGWPFPSQGRLGDLAMSYFVVEPATGLLYFGDGGRIRRLDPRTGALVTKAGGEGGSYFDGYASQARFARPTGLAFVGTKLYIADSYTIRVFDTDFGANSVSTLAGSAFMAGTTDGIGAGARFGGELGGLAWDGADALYVADTANQTIRRVTLSTGEVTTVAGTPGQTQFGAGGFFYPVDVVHDAGRLIVTNHDGEIRHVDLTTGLITLHAQLAPHGRFGCHRDTLFRAVRDGDRVLVGTGKSLVQILDMAGTLVDTLLGGATGSQWAVRLGALPGGLNCPSAMAVMPDGSLVIADANERAILRLVR